MILVTVLFASVITGQLEAPELGKPVHVDLKDESAQDFYGTCVTANGDVWQFQYDYPDDQTTRKTFNRSAIFDWQYEDAQARQQRFDEYRANQGLVKTKAGAWIPKTQYEFAEKARESALALEEQRQQANDEDALIQELSTHTATEQPESPGFLTLWGPQIALALGAVALIGIIVKLVTLGGERPTGP